MASINALIFVRIQSYAVAILSTGISMTCRRTSGRRARIALCVVRGIAVSRGSKCCWIVLLLWRVSRLGGLLRYGGNVTDGGGGFDEFVAGLEPRLRRAFVGSRGVDGAADAVAEALGWAWEHWDEVQVMANPAGYLYRVGQSRTRTRKTPSLPPVEDLRLPEVEPMLVPALLELSEQQRTAVWLVHGCHWRQTEAAEAMGITTSAVSTHVARALAHLRDRLEVEASA